MCHATRLSVVSYLDSTSNHNLKFLNYVIIIRCFISWFYIKPQLIRCLYITQRVVSYLDSTSNHNCCNLCFNGIRLFHILILHQTTTQNLWKRQYEMLFHILILHQTTTALCLFLCRTSVVSYLDSTSNHNEVSTFLMPSSLFHILILHQTTTSQFLATDLDKLFHILILHQTTTHGSITEKEWGCFISWFYIKPQLKNLNWLPWCVVSYLDSTSNHNSDAVELLFDELFHILILHQTTTTSCATFFSSSLFHILILHQTTTPEEYKRLYKSCFISWFYIKPQHNQLETINSLSCFISWFYIKPQLLANKRGKGTRCFISWFYIKPQLQPPWRWQTYVVSYLDSTSNHNFMTTSPRTWRLFHILILHQTTTLWQHHLGHDGCFISWFYIKPQLAEPSLYSSMVVSYLDSTSNHNDNDDKEAKQMLFHILILHQTTTTLCRTSPQVRCFISWFYIKPQRTAWQLLHLPVVSYLDSTSNHNRALSLLVSHVGCFISWFYIKPQLTSATIK